MPFGNDIVALTVNGTTLKSAFENSALSKSDQAMSGRFLQHSGGYNDIKLKVSKSLFLAWLCKKVLGLRMLIVSIRSTRARA